MGLQNGFLYQNDFLFVCFSVMIELKGICGGVCMSNYGKIEELKAPNKTMSMVVLAMALVYNVIFGFIRNPVETDNTLSWLGYDYPHGFLMWGVLTAAAFFLNIIYLYKKFGYSGRVGTAFAIAAIFFMPGVVFINDWGWEQTAHLIATLIFIALNAIAILMFFIHNYKKHIKYRLTTFLVILILAGMILVQFTLGKSGLLELVPLWLAMLLLFVSNFTSFYPVYPCDKAQTQKKKNVRTALKLACTLGVFGAHNLYLNRIYKGAGQLVMSITGIFLCLIPVIGMGYVNDISEGDAKVCIAAGISFLSGAAVWAARDIYRLKQLKSIENFE